MGVDLEGGNESPPLQIGWEGVISYVIIPSYNSSNPEKNRVKILQFCGQKLATEFVGRSEQRRSILVSCETLNFNRKILYKDFVINLKSCRKCTGAFISILEKFSVTFRKNL